MAHAADAVEAWVQRYGSVGSARDQIRRIATDPAGNTVVVGSTDAGISGKDWLVIKYSNAGGPLWTNRYNGPISGQDVPAAVAADTSGNVYVTGIVQNPVNASTFGSTPAQLDCLPIAPLPSGLGFVE